MPEPSPPVATPDPDHPLPPLFPGRTGKGVRVAVIDSGVHPEHPHITPDHLLPGVAIGRDGSVREDVHATRDTLGHGTAVTAAIQEKAPHVQCLPIRVFTDKLATTASALLAALRWAIGQEVDLINLSLGTPNQAHVETFSRVIAEANAAGIAVIAAHDAQGAPCLPGQLPGVLGVQLDWDIPRARYAIRAPGRVWASGYPRAIPGVAHRRNLYGISFAVAQVTGFAACVREGERAQEPAPGAALHARLQRALEPA